MPESIPLRSKKIRTHAPRDHSAGLEDSGRSNSSGGFVGPGLRSGQVSRNSSPFKDIATKDRNHGSNLTHSKPHESNLDDSNLHDSDLTSDLEFDDWDEHDASMPSDLRPELESNGHRAPLLGGHNKDEDEGVEDGVGRMSRSATHLFHERDPETQAKLETRKRYTYAAITLALSLVSFTVQTETAVYIQHQLKWEKPYCMLYVVTLPTNSTNSSPSSGYENYLNPVD